MGKMPKAARKSPGEVEETGLSGVINPEEAEDHANDLEALMANIEERVKAGDTKNSLNETLKNIKTRLAAMIPSMEAADLDTVSQAIRDKDFKVLSPRTEEREQLLEELLPSDEIPGALGVVQAVQEEDMLTETDQELIAELFDTLETAHNQLATACGLIGRLSHTLKPSQLMLVLKASIRPLIQLRTALGLDIEAVTNGPAELPDNQAGRIEVMIVPDPNMSQLKKEKINSPTRLVTATYAFKTINRFRKGTTQ